MSQPVTQDKFTIDSAIVSAFKAQCAHEGVSMTAAIQQFMKTYRPNKMVKAKTMTQPLRRKSVMEMIDELNKILDSETEYRDNIPEQFTDRFETADHACEQLVEAIANLEDAF